MAEKIILYSTGCPKCKVLEAKLNQKKIQYEVVSDIDYMMSLGFMSVPVLVVGGENLGFKEAVDYLNSVEVGECE